MSNDAGPTVAANFGFKPVRRDKRRYHDVIVDSRLVDDPSMHRAMSIGHAIGAMRQRNAFAVLFNTMRSIHVSRQMTAPRSAVWAVLADFPNIADWNGGVKSSHSTSELTAGVGAQRHCDLAPMGGLEETIAEWVEGERMVVNIDSATKLPIKSGAAAFTIGDLVTRVDYDFEPKGLLGRLMGPILSRQLRKGFDGFLADLDAAANHASDVG